MPGEVTGLELRDRLLDRDPRIMLDDRGATDCSVFILPFSLQPGEAAVVGEAIRQVLAAAPKRAPGDAPEPVSVAGVWAVEITFLKGTACHRIEIVQDGDRLTGTHRTSSLENPVSGTVRGNRVVLTSLHRFEGTHLAYRFEGSVTGGEMAGTVAVGSSGQSAPGPLNQREYGTVRWSGQRVTDGT